MSTAINSQKITVTLPQPLLTRLDEIVPTRQRSAFISQAVQAQLALLEQAQALDETAGIWSDTDYPELGDDAAIDGWLNTLRQGWQQYAI